MPESKKYPWFKFWCADFVSNSTVQMMTPAQKGGYISLLCNAWLSGDCSIPNNEALLAQISGLGPTWAADGPLILQCWKDRDDDCLECPRLVEEWEAMLANSEIQAAKGRASAKARRTKIQPDTQPRSNHGSTTVENRLPKNTDLGQPEGNRKATQNQPSQISDLRSQNPDQQMIEGEGLSPPTPMVSPARIRQEKMQEFQLRWNKVAKALKIPQCKKLTDKRKQQLNTRFREKEWCADAMKALVTFKDSPFLQGNNDQGWRANFDWFIKPDSVTMILEGKYADKKKQTPTKTREEIEGEKNMRTQAAITRMGDYKPLLRGDAQLLDLTPADVDKYEAERVDPSLRKE